MIAWTAPFPEAAPGPSYSSAPKLLDTVAIAPGNAKQQSGAPAAHAESDICDHHMEGWELHSVIPPGIEVRQAGTVELPWHSLVYASLQ